MKTGFCGGKVHLKEVGYPERTIKKLRYPGTVMLKRLGCHGGKCNQQESFSIGLRLKRLYCTGKKLTKSIYSGTKLMKLKCPGEKVQ